MLRIFSFNCSSSWFSVVEEELPDFVVGELIFGLSERSFPPSKSAARGVSSDFWGVGMGSETLVGGGR